MISLTTTAILATDARNLSFNTIKHAMNALKVNIKWVRSAK